jgi:hypothetical protein
LGDFLKAELFVIAWADPFGRINGAALKRRIDFDRASERMP